MQPNVNIVMKIVATTNEIDSINPKKNQKISNKLFIIVLPHEHPVKKLSTRTKTHGK